MSHKSLGLSSELHQYLVAHSVQETEVQRQLRAETAQHPMGQMQISSDQGQFLAWLVQLMGARRTLEVGVFTGYSTLAVALALPTDGQVVACDISAEYTAIAQRYWQQAGVIHKIDLRLAPAADTLAQLIAEGHQGSFDFAFIDADKRGYPTYYEQALTLVRPGGVIAVDNVLWSGRVADAAVTDSRTQILRDFNQRLSQDPRVTLTMLPVADGLTLARRNS